MYFSDAVNEEHGSALWFHCPNANVFSDCLHETAVAYDNSGCLGFVGRLLQSRGPIACVN